MFGYNAGLVISTESDLLSGKNNKLNKLRRCSQEFQRTCAAQVWKWELGKNFILTLLFLQFSFSVNRRSCGSSRHCIKHIFRFVKLRRNFIWVVRTKPFTLKNRCKLKTKRQIFCNFVVLAFTKYICIKILQYVATIDLWEGSDTFWSQ